MIEIIDNNNLETIVDEIEGKQIDLIGTFLRQSLSGNNYFLIVYDLFPNAILFEALDSLSEGYIINVCKILSNV